ncbi:unnamed protein product [Prorocentrum cordatum]|uniref:EF-hand domain-containing protein n=1 Tax=Prorocentrum cordatum TaxID=2364126 RepID=A0ABN9U935_9DINO|nr:unnamed protein product [Polarella glacialis]
MPGTMSRPAAQEAGPSPWPGHPRAAGDADPGPAGHAEDDAELRGQIGDLWRQEQKMRRELREMQQGQQAILQVLQDLRSAGDGSSHAELQARPGLWHTVQSNATSHATSGSPRTFMVKSPAKGKVPLRSDSSSSMTGTDARGNANSAQQDAIARRDLYRAGRNLKDNAMRTLETSWDFRASANSSLHGSSLRSKIGVRGLSRFCRRISHSKFFDAFVGVIIFSNSLCIGISLQWELDGRDISTLEAVENVFLAFYVVEVGILLAAWGRHCFHNAWFIFDFFLVSVGVFSEWMLPSLLALMDSGDELGFLEQVLVVRSLRLLRLVRALRAMELFKDMWKLVRGMIGSARTVTSACLLIFGSLYLFGCIGVQLMAEDEVLQGDPRTAQLMELHFSSLPMAILTLVQFANYDSIASIYVPIIKVRPVLCVYFITVILVVPVCLMNLVTALIVDHAIGCAKTDADMAALAVRRRLRDLKPQINQVFKALDQSGDGHIQFSEIDFDTISIPDDLRDIIQPALLSDLFEFLDVDDSGELDEQEFENGVCHLALSSGMQGVSIESTQMIQMLRQQISCIQDLQERVCFLHERGMLACLQEMGWPEVGSRCSRTRVSRRAPDNNVDAGGGGSNGALGTPEGGVHGSTAAPTPRLHEAWTKEMSLDSDFSNDEPMAASQLECWAHGCCTAPRAWRDPVTPAAASGAGRRREALSPREARCPRGSGSRRSVPRGGRRSGGERGTPSALLRLVPSLLPEVGRVPPQEGCAEIAGGWPGGDCYTCFCSAIWGTCLPLFLSSSRARPYARGHAPPNPLPRLCFVLVSLHCVASEASGRQNLRDCFVSGLPFVSGQRLRWKVAAESLGPRAGAG